MVIVECSVPNCDFKTQDVSDAIAVALLNNHGLAHQALPPAPTAPPPARGPKLDRPKVDIGISIEEWNIFMRRWGVFRSGSGITDAQAPFQLFQCAGPDLGDSLLKANPGATSLPLQDLTAAMRSLAVIPIATCVLRTELLQLKQERDETFRAFAARVRGKAETCAYTAACACGQPVDYTDHIIRDVLLNGIYDSDIRRETLGITDILTNPINDVIASVESKEMARNALPSSTLSAMSSFQRNKNTPPSDQSPSAAEKSRQASCPDCKVSFHVFSEGSRGWNSKPHQVCIDCYRARRRKRRQPAKSQQSAIESGPISQIASLQSGAVPRSRGRPQNEPAKLDHHIFTKGEWRRAQLRDHPRTNITISLDTPSASGATSRPRDHPVAQISAVADTGAQSDLWSLEEFLACGFSRDELQPVNLSLSAANRSPIAIDGAFFAKLSTAPPNGEATCCRSMVYVSSSVRAMYLSYESLLNLGLLSTDFPTNPVGRHDGRRPTPHGRSIPEPHSSINATRSINGGCTAPNTPSDPTCHCPQRTVPPQRPSELPFPCTPENNGRMKDWLLERYASSTFNTCPHRALPCMDGPPIEIHVDPAATPRACHTPATIPLHWQQKVYDDLLRDEALGVIERVPYGEPVTWCHRMVVTRKHDGSPRRTVDLSPLNKFCQRETFAMESPFHLARRIPKDTWKTVTDAWNGYHSVPLREADRHLTTFITPFGRWRYTRAPQGFLSSGDGYNRRFDAILSAFERKERCVDDTIHYDTDLEQHWWRSIDFLTCVGQSGIVLNPDKFQFAEKCVDFAGFRVSDSTIEPLPKYLDAIRDFPTPESTTDIRSWFGLVNQVANYAQLRETMAPFKPFLSPRCKFTWSPDLESAFQESKEAIVQAIREGVEIYDMQRRTCLRPDWSRRGIGYFLLQQHCSCPSGIPDCCPGGWRITLAGSRFLSPAEQRYAAIEGEALAVAWGLEQTRYFTQGCDNLVVVTDHKPLVKIFGDRTLDEITNSRLFRLKQRTLPWRFTITHRPGKSNQAADATSRHPSPSGSTNSLATSTPSVPDMVESALMASIRNDAHDLGAISWPILAQETATDPCLGHLLRLIEQDVVVDPNDPALSSLGHLCESIYAQDGVLLLNDRVVVPMSLRKRVLQHLHAAHQGASTMEQQARAIVFWPGMSRDIQGTRDGCTDCNRNAPSQAATPPLPTSPPSTPFEAVYADFFDFGGRHYLVVGDRLSGWVEVLSSTAGTDLGGSAGLVRHLRAFFATFGVPTEISSDGGPEFTAGGTETFLRLWGIKHRLSSVGFPQSNGRAEVSVKTAKRLLMSNTGPNGSLDNDRFLRAMLQLRNTPDRDCDLSPAQIIFGRPLRDSLMFVNRLEKFSNPHIRPLWRQAWAAKEDALRTRISRTTESLTSHSKPLRPLKLGERVFIQNQQGPHPNKWDRSGMVVESPGHDQYRIKVDGSGRLTLRNRRFLRAYTPATPTPDHQYRTPPPPPRSPECQPTLNSSPSPPTGSGPLTGNPHVTTQLSHGSHPVIPTECNQTVPPAEPVAETPPTTQANNDPVSSCMPDASSQAPQPLPEPRRPTRARTRPKRYEPETGNWTVAGVRSSSLV
ncbi:uncharacterized protein LOC125573262 [Nematostella vectensis]|uniref:uncharacterized protein LOC125573262 n=1 Tax=Nematostella vectensis TaxID=45351 RepID=UPI0020777D52|nr:uncharacterized protein LOC125573262 [Nematostella vectensis]